MRRSLFWMTAAALAVSGCSFIPRYERPASPVAEQWPDAAKREPESQTAAIASEIAWENFFGDARLRRLIGLALKNNRDLRVAALNVEQVRAQFRVAELAYLPTLDANGGVTRSRSSADLAASGRSSTSTNISVALAIPSYELDLFGRVRSLRDQALELFLATEEARNSAHLALVSQVATQYLAQRAIAEELRLAGETLEAVQSSFRLAQERYKLGAASRLDFITAETQVQSALADVSSARQQLAQADNALAFLIGGPLPADLPPPAALDAQGFAADLAPGLPSQLLQRRPDIRQAEHELKAANAAIGAARAAFFPEISLTAAFGAASSELSRLFDANNRTWNFAPRITQPLFTAGRNRATLDVAQLQKEIQISRYERAIQNAFREVADALVVRAYVEEQIAAYDALARAQQQRFTLAEARYKQGVDSYLAVLTAQRDLYAAQQNQIRARFGRYSNLIGLYGALGGGWQQTSPSVNRTAASQPGATTP